MTDTEDDAPAERGSAEPWLERLKQAEKAMDEWQEAADNIDKIYASLSQLRNVARDREFQMFWANTQILAPSIYSRPPIPVVTPKFKDRRPLYRTASEFLERACIVTFDAAGIDETMLLLRDDLAILARGAGWLRYESDDSDDRVCIEHLDRRDFRHQPARKWADVDWVARRGWMTKKAMKARFGQDASDEATYVEHRDSKDDRDSTPNVAECGVWEIWCRSENTVVWVVEGSETVLEQKKPHLKLSGFFPCPKPAYGTLERRSLVPVPDMLQYKDQLEEINDLTRRIHGLAEALRLRGFYAGGGDIGEALERAMNIEDDRQVLIPVPRLGALSTGTTGGLIEWMPLEQVANTITGLIDLRRQVIDDVYQIMGLSDIMRGATEAEETLGAQQLKQQNGSIRVRDKQQELVRWARDAVRIAAEILAEEFDADTLVEMAQMDLPTNADIKKQVKAIEAQAKDAVQQLEERLSEAEQKGEQLDPQEVEKQASEQMQGFQQQIAKLTAQVTIDQVKEFLRDEKLRPYVLDIETDSTVSTDEMSEKASRSEFMTAFTASMSALVPMMQMGPEAIAVAGGVFKFALAPYRVGRELEGLIDDFVDNAPAIAERAQAQQGEGEDQGLAAAQMKLAEAEMAKVQSQTEANTANAQLKMQELQLKASEAQAKTEQDQQRFGLDLEKTRGAIAELDARTRKVEAETAKLGVDASNQTRKEDREDAKAASDIQSRQVDQALAVQDRDRQAFESDRQAAIGARQQGFAEQQGVRSDDRADRQQQFTEKQPPKSGG